MASSLLHRQSARIISSDYRELHPVLFVHNYMYGQSGRYGEIAIQRMKEGQSKHREITSNSCLVSVLGNALRVPRSAMAWVWGQSPASHSFQSHNSGDNQPMSPPRRLCAPNPHCWGGHRCQVRGNCPACVATVLCVCYADLVVLRMCLCV